MTNRYLALAHQGKNAWWRYVLSIVIILVFYQVLGVIPLAALGIALSLDDNPDTSFDLSTLQFEGVHPLWPYVAINLIFVFLLLGLWIAMRFIHRRPLKTLITPDQTIRWRRMVQGFGLYFLLYTVVSFVSAVLTGRDIQLTVLPGQFLVFLPVALVMTPIQTTAEELLFRGYLMQGLGLKLRHPIGPILGSALLFMLPHLLNPEVAAGLLPMALLYFAIGVFLAFITVKDNRLELAIGVHAANNLFVVLILNYTNSALPSPSLFTAAEINPLSSLISFGVVAGVFYAVFWGRGQSAARP